MPPKKERIPIPPELSARVLFESDRTCCVCCKKMPVQIHHIDDDPSNNDIENLAVLCLLCHNETQLRGGFDRKLNAGQVRLYRADWLRRVRIYRQSTPRQPVVGSSEHEVSCQLAAGETGRQIHPAATRTGTAISEGRSPRERAGSGYYSRVELLDLVYLQAPLNSLAATVGRVSEELCTEILIFEKAASKARDSGQMLQAEVVEGPINRIQEISTVLLARLRDLDLAIISYAKYAPPKVRADPHLRPEVCKDLTGIYKIILGTRTATKGLGLLIVSIDKYQLTPYGPLPVLNDMRLSLSELVDGFSIAEEWAKAIRDCPVKCPPARRLSLKAMLGRAESVNPGLVR